MDNRAHDQAVSEDELVFDREPTIMAPEMGELDFDDRLPRSPRAAVPLPPPPPRQSHYAPRNTPRPAPFSRNPAGGLRDLNPFRPGDILAGRYQVERIAGRMGLGLVVHVRHVDLGQRLVLKCLPLEACNYPDSVARFLRGARAAMRLQGEHTARTIDAGRLSSGAPYVVTEALSGCDLREVLRVRGALTVTEAVDFVLQASEALSEAHSYGLVHKNLSLFTLFSTRHPDGSALIKVLDFGVGEALRADPMRSSELALDAATAFGSNPIVEALACSSPEQLRSSAELDPRTDIWALGAILHELLAGYPVYHAETVPGLLAMIAADPPMPVTSLRSDVPAGLESAILRCLAKDRNARFATVAEFAVALKPFASPEAQHSVDRITRTLGRSMRQPPLTSQSSALVYVGPAPSAAPAMIAAQAAPGVRFPLLLSTALVAFGLVGGTIAGVLVATRSGLSGLSRSEVATPGFEQRVLAAQAGPLAPEAQTAKPSVSGPKAAAHAPASPRARPATRAARATEPAAAEKPAAPSADGTEEKAEASAPVPRSTPASVQEQKSAPATSNSEPLMKEPAASSARAAVATGKDLFDSMR